MTSTKEEQNMEMSVMYIIENGQQYFKLLTTHTNREWSLYLEVKNKHFYIYKKWDNYLVLKTNHKLIDIDLTCHISMINYTKRYITETPKGYVNEYAEIRTKQFINYKRFSRTRTTEQKAKSAQKKINTIKSIKETEKRDSYFEFCESLNHTRFARVVPDCGLLLKLPWGFNYSSLCCVDGAREIYSNNTYVETEVLFNEIIDIAIADYDRIISSGKKPSAIVHMIYRDETADIYRAKMTALYRESIRTPYVNVIENVLVNMGINIDCSNNITGWL